MKRSEEIAKMIRKRICLLDYEKQKLKTTAELIARETGCDEPERWPRCEHGRYMIVTPNHDADEWLVTACCTICRETKWVKGLDAAIAAFRAANKEQPEKDVPNE